MEHALTEERCGNEQLRALSEAAAAISAAPTLDAKLEIITERARGIAYQGITSLTAGDDWAQTISAG